MLLRYTAGTGLFNQQYSHISAIALASVLGAELILPPGVHPSLICENAYRFRFLAWRCVCSNPYASHKAPSHVSRMFTPQ